MKELNEGLGITVNPESKDSLKAGVDQLNQTLGAKNELITLSQFGVYYQNGDDYGVHPAHLRSIADVSGAGDTVISIASLALDAGLSLEATAELANLGGGIVCESPAIVPIDPTRLKDEASSNPLFS